MKRYRLTALFLALLLALSACGGGTVPDGSGSASSADVSQTEVPPPRSGPFTLAFYPEYSLHPVLAGRGFSPGERRPDAGEVCRRQTRLAGV